VAHLVPAFSASPDSVIGQVRMGPEANEITATFQLLNTLLLKDVVVTGDAMFSLREVRRVITDGGGDDFSYRQSRSTNVEIRHRSDFPACFPLSGMVAAA
jgi:hypothetical protein